MLALGCYVLAVGRHSHEYGRVLARQLVHDGQVEQRRLYWCWCACAGPPGRLSMRINPFVSLAGESL